MLPKTVEQLVLDIAEYLDERERRAFGHKSDQNKREAQEDPQAWLETMLEEIKKRLPEVSSTLYQTIDMASCRFHSKKFRETR